MREPEFARVYRRFYELIAQPQPIAKAAAARGAADSEAAPLCGWIEAEDEDRAAARLGIYAHMYFARLRDSLREDYEVCAALLGEEAFSRVAACYLVQHPSDTPSLRHHGRHFARFLREQREVLRPLVGELRGDLAELAELEWARIEVFDAAHAALLRPAALESLSPADWPELALRLVPAVRLVERAHGIEDVWRACNERRALPPPRLAPGTTLVWRRGFVSRHRALPEDEARALRLLVPGASFADLCGVLAEGLEQAAAARRAAALLRQWLVDELLSVPAP